MIYKVDLTIPPLQSFYTPVEVHVRVYPGVVRQTWIMFPRGCCGLAHVCIYHWGWQIWPWSPGHSFAWDDYVYTFHDNYPVTAEPLEFVMKGWSFDDSYSHTISLAIHVEPTAKEEIETLEEIYEALGLLQESE